MSLWGGVVEWMEASLTVPHGPDAGSPLRIWPWERAALRGILAPDTSIAALSVARGNGKSCLIAALATAYIQCPLLRRSRAEILIGSPSHRQSQIVFKDVLQFIGPETLADRKTWSTTNNQLRSELVHKPTGSVLACMSSLHRKSHGFRPSLMILEEPAQLERAVRDPYFAAAQTSLGKAEGGRVVAIGTAPGGSEPHWFGDLLADDSAADWRAYYRVPGDVDPLDARRWIRGNPSLPYLPSLRKAIHASARLARKDPDALAAFRELRLNQGFAHNPERLLIAPETWRRMAETEELPDRAGPLIVGIDLAVSGLAGFAGYWPSTGRLEAFGVFPERPALDARGRADGVGGLYEKMASRGELLRLGRSTVDVAAAVGVAVQRWGQPTAVAADRFRAAALGDALRDAGVTAAPALRGAGFRDGGQDTADFLSAVLERHVRTLPALAVRSCLAVARIVHDPAGNRKLVRRGSGKRKRSRDDVAAAIVLAVAVGFRERRAQRLGAGGVRLHVVGPWDGEG